MEECLILGGTAHPALAAAMASEAGIRVGACAIERFPDGEIFVRLLEPVRQREIFLVQPLAPPVNDHLVELLIMADACRRAAARHITAVIPYLGYSRSDRRHGGREAISCSMLAALLETVGINHVISMDLHAPQIEGFFHVPFDCLTAVPTMCQALEKQLPSGRLTIVSPDAGRVAMASAYAHHLDAPVAVLHKRRTGPAETFVTHLTGDVRNTHCLIIDDMISTGGTIATAADVLGKAGALPGMMAAVTHGLLLPGARERLSGAGIAHLFVTNTLTLSVFDSPQLHVVSVAQLFAQTLRQFIADGSLEKKDIR